MSPDRITYVGHATVLIELGGVRVLTDPVLRPRLLRIIRRQAGDPEDHVTEDIDVVLVSHLHHDHLDFASLKRVGRDTPVVVPVGAGRTLRRRGYRETIELGPGARAQIGNLEIVGTHAIHEGRRFKFGPKVDAAGYDVSAGGPRVYFAGDTDLFDEMAELAGRIDVALLPIAGWGPKQDIAGHLNPRRAAEAAALIRPRVAIPIHWGTLLRFDLRGEADTYLAEPARDFVAAMRELAPEVDVRVLAPGESLNLSG